VTRMSSASRVPDSRASLAPTFCAPAGALRPEDDDEMRAGEPADAHPVERRDDADA
jgi:hypothetical protein